MNRINEFDVDFRKILKPSIGSDKYSGLRPPMSHVFKFMVAAMILLYTGQVRAEPVVNLSAANLFQIAEQAKENRAFADAEAIYRALSRDPEVEIRAEARFRLGVMLTGQKRYTDAAVTFRALLDEKPNAARVRLELARVLALMGDESGARKQLRQAQAAGLPPQVAIVVDQFANALRSRKTLGGSFEIALTPDTNINRATDAKVLDTIIAPLNLDKDARARSGLGLKLSGQGYARLRLGKSLSLLPRLSGSGVIYRDSQFNDISASAQFGVEWLKGKDRWQPAIGYTWRWYGKDPYARTKTASLGWQHPIGSKTQLEIDGSAGKANYIKNDLQDGWLYSFGTSLDRALTQRSGIQLSVSALRQTARDRGYSLASGGAGALYWCELGKMTVFGSLNARRLEADARLFPFTDRRKEWYVSAQTGATFRQLIVAGFAPVLRATYERNWSSVAIYDYRRFGFEVGINRAF